MLNDEKPAPIPITLCLGGCGKQAQPQNGICPECEKRKGTWPLAAAVILIVAVAGLISSCAPKRVDVLSIRTKMTSTVTYRVPRRPLFHGEAVKWDRQEEWFENPADAVSFFKSFTPEERKTLEVEKTDFVSYPECVNCKNPNWTIWRVEDTTAPAIGAVKP